MFKKILLLPSSNDVDQPSVRRALEFCGAGDSVELTIFRPVYEPHLEGYLGNADVYEKLRQRLVDEQEGNLESLAAAISDKGCKSSVSCKWANPLHAAVSSQVSEKDIDLVVLAPVAGSRHLSRAEWQLVTHCSVPTLVVNSEAASPYRKVIAAVDPYHEHGKPQDLDLKIIRAAGTVSASSGASLNIVNCYTPLSEIAVHGYSELPLDTAEKALESAREHALEALVAEAAVEHDDASIVSGRPDKILAAKSRDKEVDLIVMGAVSRGRIKDLFIGSTAERVLEEAASDVLVIKPDHTEE